MFGVIILISLISLQKIIIALVYKSEIQFNLVNLCDVINTKKFSVYTVHYEKTRIICRNIYTERE